MKALIYIALSFFAISSCKPVDKKIIVLEPNKKWSQDSLRKYFKDSIAYRKYNGKWGAGDSLNDFDKFAQYVLKDIKAKNINDPLIFGFDENYIDTTKID